MICDIKNQNSYFERPEFIPVLQDLVLWYVSDDGDNTIILDRSGNANNGTISNTTRILTHPSGIFGSHLNFPGSGRVVVANSTSINITGPITIDVWIKTAGANMAIVDKRVSWVNGYDLWVTSAGTSRMALGDGLVTLEHTNPTIINDNVWHNIVAKWDGLNTPISISVDGGTPTQSIIKTSAIPANTGPLYVSYSYPNTGYYFTGELNQLKIYNRSLTDAETTYNHTHNPIFYMKGA